MKEYKFIVMAGSAKKTRFMQYCDLFSHTKVLGEVQELSIKAPETTDKAALFKAVREALEKSDMIISFIYYDLENFWYNKEVQTVSNGSDWFKLCDWITHAFPFLNVEHDQYYMITKITAN